MIPQYKIMYNLLDMKHQWIYAVITTKQSITTLYCSTSALSPNKLQPNIITIYAPNKFWFKNFTADEFGERGRIQWYHISYCHSMIPFPSLPVFWKPEYEINENIDFKPTISSIACWEPSAFDLSAVCFWFPILSHARAPEREYILYCPQSFSGGGLYSSGNGLLLIIYDWLLWL